jgi:small nuclear ribonucleoprotein D2
MPRDRSLSFWEAGSPFSSAEHGISPSLSLAPMFLPTAQNSPDEKEKAELAGPLSLLHRSMAKEAPVLVSMRNNKKVRGVIMAYDRHYNILLRNAREIGIRASKNKGRKKKDGKEVVRDMGCVFLRGDSVILVANAIVEDE